MQEINYAILGKYGKSVILHSYLETKTMDITVQNGMLTTYYARNVSNGIFCEDVLCIPLPRLTARDNRDITIYTKSHGLIISCNENWRCGLLEFYRKFSYQTIIVIIIVVYHMTLLAYGSKSVEER